MTFSSRDGVFFSAARPRIRASYVCWSRGLVRTNHSFVTAVPSTFPLAEEKRSKAAEREISLACPIFLKDTVAMSEEKPKVRCL